MILNTSQRSNFMNATIDSSPVNKSANDTPFDLSNDVAYQKWRQLKLANHPAKIEDMLIPIKDIKAISADELQQLHAVIDKHNLVIYDLGSEQMASKTDIRQFARRMGLDNIDNNICSDEDSITTLQVSDAGQKKTYIPYTNRPLSWHADGYYNPLDKQIRGMLLHCVRPAVEGGENMLLDPEMLYIQLRDENPDWIKALMVDDVMTIPANNEGESGEQLRPDQTGPVFSIEKGSNCLHMRYSARTRNIIWRDDALTTQATVKISEYLNSSPYILRYRLKAGQGVICNNVLHNRTAFKDSDTQHRLLYRARFYDRLAGAERTSTTNQVN